MTNREPFNDADKALIREIARVVIDEVLEYKIHPIVSKFCAEQKGGCEAKSFYEAENNRYILAQLVEKSKNQKERRVAWAKWFIGSGLGVYGIKELLEHFHKK